jgi:hypothetical protein
MKEKTYTGSKYIYTDTTIKLLNSDAIEDIVTT